MSASYPIKRRSRFVSPASMGRARVIMDPLVDGTREQGGIPVAPVADTRGVSASYSIKWQSRFASPASSL